MSDEGGVTYYQNQNYNQIKSYCLRNNGLFEDEYFPADDSSIAKCQPINKRISWKRPREFCSNPVFIDNSIEPNDLDQGQLGDCWFITGAVAVASVPEYIRKVIPEDQTFDDNDYAGVFRFRFWRFGKWVEVVVDDRLPVDDNDTLIYCHNRESPNEMFGPLLEKAYAKLNSCYEFLECGLAIDAMIDMTGGVHESFALKKKDKTTEEVDTNTLWEIIFKSFERKSLAGSFINSNGGTSREQVQANSLVLGHAYCVLEAFEILPNRDRYDHMRSSSSTAGHPNSIKLLRMRNPWGKDQSYKGAFDASSSIWRKISDDIQSQVSARTQVDGQFLIEYKEFAAQFDQIDFVHVDFNAFYDSTDNTSNKWTSQMIFGAWVAGKNAGGCGNDDIRNYWLNPQYGFKVPSSQNGGKVSIIGALLQCDQVKNRLKSNGSFSESNIPQAFTIYRINNQDGNLKRKYDEREMTEVGGTGIYVGKKEVSKRIDVDPGYYVIVPSLFDKDAESSFVIRLFFETDSVDVNEVEVKKLKYEQPVPQEQEEQPPVQVEDDGGDGRRRDYNNRHHRGGRGGEGGRGRGHNRHDDDNDEDRNRYEERPNYQQENNEQSYQSNGYSETNGNYNGDYDSGYSSEVPRRRYVEAPIKINNVEEMGRFSSFLSHAKNISQVKEELSNMVLNNISDGLSIKNSRACILM